MVTNNFKETADLGFRIGQTCLGGEIFALYGNLGAGKTTFLQGLAQGLGVKMQVNSPTFNILKLYKTKPKSIVKEFCHIDAYRLSSEKDLIALGVNEFLKAKDTVTAIEWVEKVESILPKKIIRIYIENTSESSRKIKIKRG